MWREGGQGMEVWGAASAGVGAELPGHRSQKGGMADTGQGGGEVEERGEGTTFWRKMSQTGVDKDHDERRRGGDLGDGEDEKAEPLRRVLQKKRSSLSHKPDIIRMFEKESDKAQQTPHVPKFFKVDRQHCVNWRQ